jgi:hypothetical protein
MNFVQAATMPTVAGETVKPGQVRVAKICGIPVRFSLWQISASALMRVLQENRGIRHPRVAGRGAARLTGSLPLPEAGLLAAVFCGETMPENTGAGLGRRDGLNLVPTRNRAGWNAMKRGIGF